MGTNIGVAYEGKCQQLIPDIPPKPAEIPRCSINCLAIKSFPVCGTDGKTYRSGCALGIHNCQKGTNIREAYKGKCKPLISEPLWSGGCPLCLTKELRPPVCGTDGNTYDPCLLRAHNCKMGTNIGVAYEGKCKAPPVACPIYCNKMWRPRVCGTDGMTYDPCFLRVHNCKMGTNIGVAHRGECKPMIITERPPQACPMCLPGHKPVCGTDGITYQSECYLETANCNKVTDIVEVANEGECKEVVENGGGGSGNGGLKYR